ncbi:Zn-ribbon domain-containing OB-fold protein [Achromobacter anxifer]
MSSAPTANTGTQKQYFDHLAQGRFLIQRCADCARHVFHPREICPHCGSDALAWIAPAGRAIVYSCTTVARKPEAGGDYNVSLVDLEEGVRMMSNVVGMPPEQVRIGMAVRAVIGERDGAAAVLFEEARQ